MDARRYVDGFTRRSMLLASCLAVAGAPTFGARGDPFVFGLTPVFLSNDQVLLSQIRQYLSDATGRDVRLVQRRTYQEITAMLLAGQIDAAWICGYPYVRHKSELALLAVPVWRGHPLYQAYVIAGKGRGAMSLQALRGDIHAFSDPDSNSGYLTTRAALGRLGASPGTFFARDFFTYGHRNVVRAVASGLAQSGSVDGYVWEALRHAEPGLADATEVVQRSPWFGFPPIACLRERAKSATMRRLERALHRMSDDPTAGAVLSTLQLDGFQPAQPQLFDDIAALATIVGTPG